MRANIYALPGKIGLKFDSPNDRDQFWSGMAAQIANGFSPQQAAEKIGQFTIRIYADRVKEGFSWPAELLPVQSQSTVLNSPPAPSPRSALPREQAAPAKIIEPPNPANTVTVGAGTDPFVRTGTNVTKALPGLVAAKSNVETPEPPQMPIPEVTTPPPPAPVELKPEPPPAVTGAPAVPAPKRRGRPPKAKSA